MRHYDSHSDTRLISLLKDGDEEAFTTLYRRYWDRLFYIGGRLLGNLAVAEEIVQDIFLDLWQRRDRLEIKGTLEHYLVVAIRYRVINWQARRDRDTEYQHYAARTLSEQDLGTEEQLRLAELTAWLETLVSKMPEKCRLAYRLREEGLSRKEIARRMQVEEKTVENHITRALRYLRAGLSELFSLFVTLGLVCLTFLY